MRVEIWGSQVHVVDIVSGTVLLVLLCLLVVSGWVIRRKGFRGYCGDVRRTSVATLVICNAFMLVVFQILAGFVTFMRSGDSEDSPCYYGVGFRKVGQITTVLGKSEYEDDGNIL
ncbi:hypothetical protein [uncultured Halomonas sp.]|uniref:hypothetical protein n=1 Tax=uncultured Halomonas sp. TaxID=173971 RepID=UPI002614E702|nr:hypothetical protein [uncultured Halomonas sp.]